MDVNSLPKAVTRQRRGCDSNPGPSAPESSMLTTRLPSHPPSGVYTKNERILYTQHADETAAAVHETAKRQN